MDNEQSVPHGLWLPLVTPFRDGALDEASLRRLVRHYASEPIEGLILGATTGEGTALDEAETERLVEVVADECVADESRIPLFLGLSGCNTKKLVATVHRTASWTIDGYLIASPYYVTPSQEGLFQHFTKLAQNTPRPILIYNIPYRCGVNLDNKTMLRLAAFPNIVGAKDCSGSIEQSNELLRLRPSTFAILTGEDAQFYSALTHGADGGILVSAHVLARPLSDVRNTLIAGDHITARSKWHRLAHVPDLLFDEPNPAPVKYWLWRAGLIASPEVRLPMTNVSDALAERIDHCMESFDTGSSNVTVPHPIG